MKAPLFQGVCTALVTPFKNDEIDYQAFDALLERQLRAKVDALVVCGTTGEASTLSDTEKLALFSHTVAYINGRCIVIAGTGSNCTSHAARLSAEASAIGVDGLLVVTPYYNKCTQKGLIAHYEAISSAVLVPIIVYNVPSRTGVDIAVPTCKALAEIPHICGIKEANPDVARVSAIQKTCGRDFSIWCGNDDRVVPFYAAGARGVISVVSNLLPEAMVELTHCCSAGEYTRASALQSALSPLLEALFSQPNPIPVKTALRLCGLDVGRCRLPLSEMDAEPLERLKHRLQQMNLLPS